MDANVCIDVIQDDPVWGPWSAKELARARNRDEVAINPIIAAEVSLAFGNSKDLDRYLGSVTVKPSSVMMASGKSLAASRRFTASSSCSSSLTGSSR